MKFLDALKLYMTFPLAIERTNRRLDTLLSEVLSQRQEEEKERAFALLRSREVVARALLEALPPPERAPAPRDDRHALEDAFAELSRLAPEAFALWRPLLEVNAEAYSGFPTHSCSMCGHVMANAFRQFLLPYLRGPVLDLGCGPQEMPLYLSGYPTASIAGIDPLRTPSRHPFTFVQSVAEFLPWDAGSFQTVVCATSLDHVLLLDRVLAEVHRVLKPNGWFVLWVAFVSGAEPYDPYRSPSRKDEFHLFHFDRAWFEAVLDERFALDEAFGFGPSEMSWFYSYRPR